MGKFILFGFLMVSTTVFAQGSKDIVVNIDSPNFRKLVMAIPTFSVESKDDVALVQLAKDGVATLKDLMLFTGLFNVLAEDAYKGMEIAAGPFVKGANPNELSGIKIPQWKTIGVEALTVGRLARDQSGLVVELMTVDINKGEIILGKRFTRVGDIKIILRRYADLLLQAYTGKPGIFSSKLAFVGRRQKGDEKQIFISDFDGSNLIQVTKEKFIHLSPNWSPDGKKLVFTSFRSGNPDLYTYDLTNGTVKVLSNSPGMNSGGAFTPDGSQVAFTGAIAGDTDIFLIDAKGGQRKAFIQGQGLDVDPAFSPDGKYIAYVSGRYGNPHIFLGELTKVNNQFRVVRDSRMTWQGWYNTTPSWTYDSAKIAFAGYDREIDRYDIFIMNPDSKKQQLERLTIRSGDNESPSWSPNGQLLVFQSNRSGDQNVKSRAQLWVMNRDGSHQRKLDIGLYEVFTPKWGPQIED